jgi:hypothetical protein
MNPGPDTAHRSTVAVPSDRTRLKGEDQSTTRDVMLNGERLVIAMIADGHGGKEAPPHCKEMVVDERP